MFGNSRGALIGAVVVFGAVSLSAAPVKESDPLLMGSKWKGKLTQKGQINGADTPLELEAELTVTRRDGEKFEAELYEHNDLGIRLTYLVRGQVTRAKGGKGYKVEFKSYDFKDAQSLTFLNIPYTGTVEGKKLKGTWKHPKNDEGTTIEGTFDLELAR